MLIKLDSQLFTTHPARRFANKYAVPETMWMELWKRYKMLEYTPAEMAEYFQIKTGKSIKKRQVKRWVFLTEIFAITKPARDMGAQVVNTEIFGIYEGKVIDEIMKHIKSGGTKNCNIIV